MSNHYNSNLTEEERKYTRVDPIQGIKSTWDDVIANYSELEKDQEIPQEYHQFKQENFERTLKFIQEDIKERKKNHERKKDKKKNKQIINGLEILALKTSVLIKDDVFGHKDNEPKKESKTAKVKGNQSCRSKQAVRNQWLRDMIVKLSPIQELSTALKDKLDSCEDIDEDNTIDEDELISEIVNSLKITAEYDRYLRTYNTHYIGKMFTVLINKIHERLETEKQSSRIETEQDLALFGQDEVSQLVNTLNQHGISDTPDTTVSLRTNKVTKEVAVELLRVSKEMNNLDFPLRIESISRYFHLYRNLRDYKRMSVDLGLPKCTFTPTSSAFLKDSALINSGIKGGYKIGNNSNPEPDLSMDFKAPKEELYNKFINACIIHIGEFGIELSKKRKRIFNEIDDIDDSMEIDEPSKKKGKLTEEQKRNILANKMKKLTKEQRKVYETYKTNKERKMYYNSVVKN